MKYMIYLQYFLLLPALAGNAQTATTTDEECSPFAKGTRAPSANFTGVVWSQNLVSDDKVYNCVIGNVTFEPGARSNWHYHNSGQILLITSGTGYYQEKGKPVEVMHEGDVIKCPPNVEHWHGASHESPCTHIAIVPNTEKGVVKWLGPVSDEQYDSGR